MDRLRQSRGRDWYHSLLSNTFDFTYTDIHFDMRVADPILENLKALPGRVERTIATLEKHARTLEKEESGEASAAEKKAKALLSKLS